MSTKTVKTRVQNKHETKANWDQATNFVPLAGELIIYDSDSTHTYPRFKIGDGTTTVVNLPFLHTLGTGGNSNGDLGDITVNYDTGAVEVKNDSHTHDSRYYTESEINTKIDSINADIANLDASKAPKSHGIHYIEGTGSTAGTWLGTHEDITEYYAGLILAYKIGVAGSSSGTTLNINNLGAVTVVKNATSAISTNFAVGSVLFLVYTVDSDGTAYWKAHDYDTNTKTTTGTSNKASTKLFLTGATSQTSSGTTTYSNSKVYVGTDNHLYSNAKRVLNTDDKEECEAALAGHTHLNATATTPGFMSADDKAKLDGAQWMAEEPTEGSLFWEGSVTKGLSDTWGTVSESFTLTLGVCYKVYWNNVPYTCSTYYAGGQICLGAASLASTSHAASNENAPFVFFGVGTTGIINTVITASAITTAIPVKIYKTNITRLPNIYLPLANINPGVVKSGGSVTIANGLISIDDASTSKKGIVQLSSSTSSSSTTTAATSSAVKAAYDLANTAKADAAAAANQNAFSNIKVGSTTVAADSATDTLELVGSNVTLTPDATNDKVTIGITKANVTAALGYTPPTTDSNSYHTTGSWSGLTYTATANGGAGELKFTVPTGTSATTVAAGNHTHSYIPTSQKGAASGVAELDANGKVPTAQLPSFVDDVLEYSAKSSFPTTGETGKIYVDTSTNKTYRWSGSAYTEISASLALGETSSTAYRGDRGKIAYDHSQSAHLALGTTNTTAYYGDKGKTAYEHSQATHARTDATATAASSTNGKIKINGTDTTVYTHPTSHAASMITGLATVATSGSYNDLSNKPTIPTVNNATLTIQKNGTTVKTFTANSSSNVTANITVPTKISELTNDSGYITGITVDSALSSTSTNPVQNKVINTALTTKANDYSIELYNGTAGNPKPVKFMTVNYSTCNSENGVAVKVGMVSGHGNGSSYAFLQDAIVRVNHTGGVEVDNFKYYGAETATYDGAVRQYGDIFWVTDTTNKIVDFYCLMGQYSRVNMIPAKRLTYSSGGTITQHTSSTVYSSGTKVWANNSDIALTSDLDTKAPAYQYKTADLTANSSTLATGTLYFVYE